MPELKPAEVDFDSYIGAYDLHSYTAVFDSMDGSGYTLSDAERRMETWAKWAHARNKPFFLSEFGTMAYGWGHVDLGPACYQSGLKNASLVLRGINAGVDGFNRWSLQIAATWMGNGRTGAYLGPRIKTDFSNTFTPQPNAYYQFDTLSLFVNYRVSRNQRESTVSK